MAARQPASSADLPALLEVLIRARRALERVRATTPGNTTSSRQAQHELVQALEAYTSELMACRRPVPYRLRDELRLYRQVDRLP